MPRSPLHTAPLACLLLLWSACAFDRAPELAAEDATAPPTSPLTETATSSPIQT
jgi:hypothetical protein